MLYDMQDGSDLLQGVYATILVVCARLYLKVGRLDAGLDAVNGAISIFNRLSVDCLGNSIEQREEANLVLTQIKSKMGK